MTNVALSFFRCFDETKGMAVRESTIVTSRLPHLHAATQRQRHLSKCKTGTVTNCQQSCVIRQYDAPNLEFHCEGSDFERDAMFLDDLTTLAHLCPPDTTSCTSILLIWMPSAAPESLTFATICLRLAGRRRKPEAQQSYERRIQSPHRTMFDVRTETNTVSDVSVSHSSRFWPYRENLAVEPWWRKRCLGDDPITAKGTKPHLWYQV